MGPQGVSPLGNSQSGIQCDIQSWWEIFLENKGCGQARKYFMKELVGNLDLLERRATFVSKICSFLRQNIQVSKNILKGK